MTSFDLPRAVALADAEGFHAILRAIDFDRSAVGQEHQRPWSLQDPSFPVWRTGIIAPEDSLASQVRPIRVRPPPCAPTW
jgi:hypothetical protein